MAYIKWTIVGLLFLSVLYIHLRGRVRYGFGRQVLDHSSFMAPINVVMYLCSKVPTTPFLLPEQYFPELEALRRNWREIRQEAIDLREKQQIKASDSYNDAGFNSFFRRGWKRFYLKWYDEAHPSAATLCPVTTELLRKIPSVKAAMFAELPPGSELRRHRDPFAGSIRLHLGLDTPNDDACFISVDGQKYSWRDGEWTMFDETFVHFAENRTDHDRVILFCDVERPMKYRWATGFNRFVAKHLLAAGASPNMEGDKTGGVNKLFGHFYALRLRSKALRARNIRLYYGLKYAALILLALLVIWI